MKLSLLPTSDLWRRLNASTAKRDQLNSEIRDLLEELRNRHQHLPNNSGRSNVFAVLNIPYPWELHL